MKKFLKIIGKTLLGIIGFVLLYLLVGYCFSRITVNKEPGTKDEVAIYIKTNGVHTDIVVPTKTDLQDWSSEVKFANTVSKDSTYKYLGIGRGDKGFYLETPTWADLKFSTAFKAAFALSTTAIHATYYHALKEDSACKKIMISREQYSRLINYITDSFQKDEAGHFMPIVTNANYGNADAFYEANGHYSMLHTCNTWANCALKSCGQKGCLWTAFDTGIFLKYQ